MDTNKLSDVDAKEKTKRRKQPDRKGTKGNCCHCVLQPLFLTVARPPPRPCPNASTGGVCCMMGGFMACAPQAFGKDELLEAGAFGTILKSK